MTTLVALHDPDLGTFVGADGQATAGYLRAFGDVIKWETHANGWAAAAAGPLGAINLIRYGADSLFKNLTGPLQFGERLKGVLHKGGFMPAAEDAGPMSWGLSVILAHPTGVWDFDGALAFHAIEPRRLWAGGSGKEFALGAGEALRDLDMPPQERLERALRASLTLDVMSGGPLWIARLESAPVPARALRVKPKAKLAPKKPAARAIKKKR